MAVQQAHTRRGFGRMLAGTAALVLGLGGTPFATGQAQADEHTIIVSGASGQLGSLVVEGLLERGVAPERLILLSRSPDRLQEYTDMGASARYADFREPESLPAAMEGGDRLLLISILGDERPAAHANAIHAAAEAGVSHIAYTSYVALSQDDTSGLAADHAATEQVLKDSGVAWTMLRNSIYANGQIPAAVQMLQDGHVTLPQQVNRIGYVSREDCAAAAVAVLTGPGHENRAYDITGPELIGPREVAEAAAAVTGEEIEIRRAAHGDGPAQPPFATESIAVVSDDVERLVGRPPMSLRELFELNRSTLMDAVD